ncbi:MAG TPA: hypothetical protein VK966_02180, partial [Longimicrobiales bacterium]|nr:hypothetical protein [Longimicrobiales bacterium]
MFTRTAGVLLLIFIVLAVAWGLTHDPVDQPAIDVPRTAPPRADSTALACTPASAVSLPGQLRESSGLAVDPVGRIWSHNDSGGNTT